MIKDLLQSMNNIYSDTNLNLHEKSILMYLIKQFNCNYGYAYPKYENIMSATGIGRRANVASALKSLVVKGYITIKKVVGNKSHYFIEKYLHFVEAEIEKKVEEPSNEADSTEDKNSTGQSFNGIVIGSNVEDSINDTEELQAEEVEEANFINNPNNKRIAKEYEDNKKFKLTPFFLNAFSHIDDIVLELALKEKAKTPTLLLQKCIRISKQVGSEIKFSREFINKVLKFEAYRNEYESTEENNEIYLAWKNIGLGIWY